MRHTQLRAFDAVARYGGFVMAAEHLRLTQPAISIQVRNLEEEYALKLFRRGGGMIELTPAGQRLFALTRSFFAAEDQVRDFLNEAKDLDTGDLRLSVDGPHLAMALIATFRERYPNIQLIVSSGNAHSVWTDLIEGRADVVIVANPPANQRVTVQPIRESALHVLIPTNHPWSGRKSIKINALAGHPVILREVQSNTRRTLDKILIDSNCTLDVIMELGGREETMEAVAAGLGLGFVFAEEALNDQRVKSILISDAKIKNLDMIAALNTHRQRGVVKAFFDVVNEWSSQNCNPNSISQ